MTEKIEVSLDEIRQVTSWLAATDIEFIEVGTPGATVRLKIERSDDGDDDALPRPSAAECFVAPPAAAKGDLARRSRAQIVSVTAKTVGVFLAAHPSRSAPLVAPGSRVKQGDTIGLLRIADLCLPVVAPLAGVVTRPLVAHGSTVGYGTPLFEISPTA
jgi:acetyl-CoA carboxylase biotin carboxyl carrier protein